MSLDNYVAFFVAGSHETLKQAFTDFNTSELYTIAFETSKSSHKAVNGQHIHVLVQWTTKQYKAFIDNLKKIDSLAINGRATKDNPRTYGKIKEIKDFDRMLAYTIKGKDFLSTESSELIDKCREISFVKEDSLVTLRPIIYSYINQHVKWIHKHSIEERSSWWYPSSECPETYNPLGTLKYYMIEYFQNNEQHNMPTRSKLQYYAQYYCMYELRMPPCQLLNIFF
jgi:hypothetical protein